MTGESAEHAENAAGRYAGTESTAGAARRGVGEEGKILFQGDFSLPAPGQPATDHVLALAPVLDSLKLDFERYLNVHTSAEPQTASEFRSAVAARRQADGAPAR